MVTVYKVWRKLHICVAECVLKQVFHHSGVTRVIAEVVLQSPVEPILLFHCPVGSAMVISAVYSQYVLAYSFFWFFQPYWPKVLLSIYH